MFNKLQLLLGFALGLAATAAENPSKLAVAYAPSSGSCPAGTRLLRTTSPSNGSLNDQEQDFIGRKKNLNATVATYLNNLADYAKNHATNATLPSYLTPNNSQPLTPRIGLAVSGGGYRAAIFGLSVLHALDGRNESSNAAGLGGILQSSLYMAGLSGGSWALGSLAQANFPTIPNVFFGPSTNISEAANSNGNGVWGGWNAEVDIIPNNLSYVFDLIGGLEAKARQFPITFADIWSLALARHFMNGTTQANFNDDTSSIHGAGVLFSSVADL
jgi:lysophospholipase